MSGEVTKLSTQYNTTGTNIYPNVYPSQPQSYYQYYPYPYVVNGEIWAAFKREKGKLTSFLLFGSELDALRHAVKNGGQVKHLKKGTDILKELS